MIDRIYFKLVEKELKNKEITALIGSRQVGKTTIMKYLFDKNKEKSIFLSLDDVEVLNLFENSFKLFVDQYIKPYDLIFIDEIQYSKFGGKNLKYIYDFFEDKKIFISGSSSPELSINSLKYLVGRVNIIEVFPISFEEFINYFSKEKSVLFNEIRTQSELIQLNVEFENFLKFGSYPQVLLKQEITDKISTLKNLVNTYLLKEIKEILNFQNIFDYENLLKRLALCDGSIINKSSVSAELGITRENITKMIYIFDKTYILNILKPYHSNKIKELIKSSKIYFLDLGFKNLLINNFNNLDLRQDKGEIYENFILNNLIRYYDDFRFWNLKNNFEVDFVLEKNNEIYGFEIKSNIVSDNLNKSMKKFIELNNPKELYIFNSNLDSIRNISNTKVIFTNYLNISRILKNIFD